MAIACLAGPVSARAAAPRAGEVQLGALGVGPGFDLVRFDLAQRLASGGKVGVVLDARPRSVTLDDARPRHLVARRGAVVALEVDLPADVDQLAWAIPDLAVKLARRWRCRRPRARRRWSIRPRWRWPSPVDRSTTAASTRARPSCGDGSSRRATRPRRATTSCASPRSSSAWRWSRRPTPPTSPRRGTTSRAAPRPTSSPATASAERRCTRPRRAATRS
ncbi:MAG: hypothetical protein U1F43_09550 [Myxococcota bacterium]